MEVLADDDAQRLQAYSEGVNRYIQCCGKKLPWEFRVLCYAPEPWRPLDCLTLGKGFAFLLSTVLFTRLNMIALAAKLRGEQQKLRSLYPCVRNGTFATSEWHLAGRGSNNWVVAPSRSATGSPIFATACTCA
jgi:penicillin amidase